MLSIPRAVPLGLVLCLLTCACTTSLSGVTDDPDGGSGDLAPSENQLVVTPAETAVVVTTGAPPAQVQLRARRADGVDVTAQAAWSLLDSSYGAVRGGLVTLSDQLGVGGQTQVQARLGDESGLARLYVKVVAADLIGGGVSGSAASSFDGPPTGVAPQVVYPFDGTMLARNVNGMRLAFRAVSGATLYRVVLDSAAFQQRVFLGAQACPGGECSYLVDDKLWDRVARGGQGLGDGATIAISATAGAGQPVGQAQLKLRFSPENVRGGLYYFSTSRLGLLRLPFGGTAAAPFLLGDGVAGSVNACVGCHGVSRDGKKVAAVFAGGDGYGGVVDGSDATRYLRRPVASSAGQVWNFASFSPDGKQLIAAWRGQLSLRDGSTGNLLKTIDTGLVGGLATMPEWSPDGQSIVFVRIPPEGKLGAQLSPVGRLPAGDWLLTDSGDIAVLPYSNGNFGPAVTVVPRQRGVEYHFYPSFSPDSRWLVFNSARSTECASESAANNQVAIPLGSCVSYDQSAARLRLVRALADQTPIELSAATHLPRTATAWPKFTPFQQAGGKLVFVTYSAKFDYGFVVKQDVIRRSAPNRGRPQIWMAAIDLEKAAQGSGDPSFPPFWLPFQDPATNNHEVLWTQDIACVTAADCGKAAEFDCVAGVCVPKLG